MTNLNLNVGYSFFLSLIFTAFLNSVTTDAQSSSLLTQISMKGQNKFKSGTPLSSRSVQYRVVVNGNRLFEQGSGSCGISDPHMPGIVQANLISDPSGLYSFTAPISDTASVTNSQCRISELQSSQLESMRVDASIIADQQNCQSFCSSDPSRSCMTDCVQGQRVITASKTLTRLELDKLKQNSTNGVIQWDQDLVFSILGPPLTLEFGPDLQVNPVRASETIKVTQENFGSTSCELKEKCIDAPGNRKLLRFDANFINLGQSDLELGTPHQHEDYELDACHGHYHLNNTFLYELINPTTTQAVVVDGRGVIGRKNSFCIQDMYPASGAARTDPQFDCDYQGLSVGWEDGYDASLSCQWLDVTGVPSGSYILRLTVNPDGAFPEGNTANNSADIPVTIP
jgi:hypothetical protein